MTKAALHKYSFYRPHNRVQVDGSIVDRRTGELVFPPSRTKQSHQAECDINNIIKQFKISGMVTHVNAQMQAGAYQDLPDDMDFQVALETVRLGEVAFATLPSKIRDRFGNDPETFLGFMSNPENEKEARELGLLKAQAPPPISEKALELEEKDPPPKA